MPNILLIEDNAGDALLLREMYRDISIVKDEYDITHVTRVRDAITRLSKEPTIDLIISDMSLPDSQGIETLTALTNIASELPVIFMTGTNNTTFVNAALTAGAQDYLVKGHIDSQVLERATAYSIERKKAQLKLADAVKRSDDLEQKTMMLKNEKDQLIQLNVVKDEFISLASHQLRTPATGVKQYLGLVLSGYAGEMPKDIEVYLRTAYEANERQLNIINELLKTAQLDSGRYALQREAHDMCELVQEVINDYEPITSMRKQTVNYEQAAYCVANIDPSEIKIVVSNLLENASKYSPELSTIDLKIFGDDTSISLTVEDHGVGIPANEIPKIFDKFTRLDNVLSDTISGTGLGLYFVKRIVKLHDGEIHVTSRPHQGSKFSIRLPA